MMTAELSAPLSQIAANIDALLPSIQAVGNEEQQQLVSAMQQSIKTAIPHYERPIPDGQGDDFLLWRHDAIRPIGLCINSAELLLTDEECVLSDDQRVLVQETYDLSVTISDQVNAIFEQRVHF